MRKSLKKLLSLLLVLVMVLGLFPTFAAAVDEQKDPPEAEKSPYVFTEEDNELLDRDVFAKIDAVKAEKASAMGGMQKLNEQDYIAILPEVIEAIKASDTYVEGSLQQNGNFLVWMTTNGMPCCYDPRMEA